MHDVKRTCCGAISYLLRHFPCVAVVGARQTGKTTLNKQVLPKAPFFDLERLSDFERVQRDPEFFLSQYQEPIVIDEAQVFPAFLTALRVAVDKNRRKNGRFLISGSRGMFVKGEGL